jgi:hypothetical protein
MFSASPHEPLVHVTEPLEKCPEPHAHHLDRLFRSREGVLNRLAPKSYSAKYFIVFLALFRPVQKVQAVQAVQ